MKLARTLVVLLTISAFAQQGVAPNGYYPTWDQLSREK